MRKYFGTDGIRRIANTELSPELVYRVAKAGAYVLSKHTNHTPTILIGRDTRISGTLIESAMVAGFLSYGANVKMLGVMPTPGVAYLTKKLKADASVVISASHNTYEFNGVKYFSNKGMKIPDDIEEEIEEIMDSDKLTDFTAVKDKIGVSEIRTDLLDEYVIKGGLAGSYLYNEEIDLEKEKENLLKEKEKLTSSIERRRKLLSNENYVNKAPANVVENDREQLAKEENQLQIIEAKLK